MEYLSDKFCVSLSFTIQNKFSSFGQFPVQCVQTEKLQRFSKKNYVESHFILISIIRYYDIQWSLLKNIQLHDRVRLRNHFMINHIIIVDVFQIYICFFRSKIWRKKRARVRSKSFYLGHLILNILENIISMSTEKNDPEKKGTSIFVDMM